MLGEAALALSLDEDTLPDRVGVLTPATGIGGRAHGGSVDAGHDEERLVEDVVGRSVVLRGVAAEAAAGLGQLL